MKMRLSPVWEGVQPRTLPLLILALLLASCIEEAKWTFTGEIPDGDAKDLITADGGGDVASPDLPGADSTPKDTTDTVDPTDAPDPDDTTDTVDPTDAPDPNDTTDTFDPTDTPDPDDTVDPDEVCTPDCPLGGCGDDGCGGICGDCGPLEECTTLPDGEQVCTAEMVPIPAGTFWMGCNSCPGSTVADDSCDPDEHPYHPVHLNDYELDRTEVTMLQYGACAAAGACGNLWAGSPNCTWGDLEAGDHPANCATWAQAADYCAWAGKRLPTEAEWEKGARGGCEHNGEESGCKDESRAYPWGNAQATCSEAIFQGCGVKTEAVCSKSPAGDSPYGLCDMAGNVSEWCADWVADDYYCEGEAADGQGVCAECGDWPGAPLPWSEPLGPATGTLRIRRGGAFVSSNHSIRVSNRSTLEPDGLFDDMGFRCARSTPCVPDCDGKECGDDGCGGSCGGGCDDDNSCTEDSCSDVGVCEHTPLDLYVECDDGEYCTPSSYCEEGEAGIFCEGDGWEECDDGDPCTSDQCIEGGIGCYHSDQEGPCDDGNACTEGDACFEGGCFAGPALDCDDGNECTDDACDTATGCVFTDHEGACQGGDGICVDGACCITNCGGKTCGDDDCGGSCGGCEDGATCNENFACAADDPTVGVTWISIPSGTFMMGCAAGDQACEGIEAPQHAVTLSAFEMLETEVTEGQFEQVMGFDPSCDHNGGGGESSPVECVDWYQARAFCAAIGGRLPTEAEREYAARAHDSTIASTTWICGDEVSCLDAEAWWTSNAQGHKHDVRGKAPNAFGLYDMSGNVNEWCWDWLDLTYYQTGPGVDPPGPAGGSDKILRGGAFSGAAYNQRVSNRPYAAPTEVGYWIGVRCVRGGACVPDCVDKQCGDDGCGGSCGGCDAPAACNENFVCAETEPVTGLTWVAIPGGTFDMGCADGDDLCSSKEEPQHAVTVSPFEILETEVTEGQFVGLMGWNPSCNPSDPGGETAPVECLTWENAHGFCASVGGRLPTEAEWEYAARGGATTRWSCGDDEACVPSIGWYDGNATGIKHPVAGKAANGFGLYDMAGNVWEWTNDWFADGYYGDSPAADPLGPDSGDEHTIRGGSYGSGAVHLRASQRFGLPAGGDIGFRCVRNGACVPDCLNKLCGDDGCGGSCGGCEAPAACNENFVCAETDAAGLTWVTIPAGDFQMGCTTGDEDCNDNESPPHPVTVPAFQLLETEVTEAQYLEFVGTWTPTACAPGAVNLATGPVECIDRFEAEAYCASVGGRLPTEAEWEYAARAGTTTIYPCGDASGCLEDVAWYNAAASGAKHAVATKDVNAFGLYDMLGNVAEWVQDCWHDDYTGAPSAAVPAWTGDCDGGNPGLVRGGSYSHSAKNSRPSTRLYANPNSAAGSVGFRCARSICGDGACGSDEGCETCPLDCGCQPGEICAGDACCAPDCGGKQCGDDGCGGSCGACAAGTVCDEGVCAVPAGIWSDGEAGLQWEVSPSTDPISGGWADAAGHCDALELGGFDDWRLPDIDELRTLIEGCAATAPGGACGVAAACAESNSCDLTGCAGCNGAGGPSGGCYWSSDLDVDSICTLYWSSTPGQANPSGGAWVVDFFSGEVKVEYVTNNNGRVRCVRDFCVPDCDGKPCGDNGCGGSCGVCVAPAICNENLVCAEVDGSTGLTWVTVPGGPFVMGCEQGVPMCEFDESPAHPVTVTGFQMLETEVTEAQYLTAIGAEPSAEKAGPEAPVENITWPQAQAFCAAVGGRLPTEAEWEFAARGGTDTTWACGEQSSCLDAYAVHAGNSDGTKSDTRGKTPNALGLYDMSGNVWEWVADWYSDSYYSISPEENPQGPLSGIGRTIRGGSAGDGVVPLASHSRTYQPEATNSGLTGFRCIRGGYTCAPDCDGKACGDDGCGGSCGTCADLEECTELPGGGRACTGAMAAVAAGNFWMGCNACGFTDSAAFDSSCVEATEHPYHLVYLDAYEIDRTEVTAGQYTACVDAGACDALPTCPNGTPSYGTPGMESHPVNCLNWFQAWEYCVWTGKQLCSEAQWEKGARGGCELNGGDASCKAQSRIYPWGNDTPTCSVAVKPGCGDVLAPVCSKSPAGDSPYGLCNMAGNVREWIADLWREDYYCDGNDANGDDSCTTCTETWPGAPAAWSNPVGPPTGPMGRGLRSGSFVLYDDVLLRTASRGAASPGGTSVDVGVRCCR